MSAQYTVTDHLTDRLKELGIDHVFGVPGDFVFPFCDAVELRDDMEWIGSCNELNAAYSADGYARSRRGAGAYAVTAGVGDLSATCGLANAMSERVPVVAIAGQPPVKSPLPSTHHSIDGDYSRFVRMMAEITVDHALLGLEGAPAAIDRVLESAWHERRPVWIGLPMDVAAVEVPRPSKPLHLDAAPSDPKQLAAFTDAAAALLEGAKAPAILADFPVGRFAFTDAVQDFATTTGLPFTTTLFGKSAFFDMAHPNFAGMYFPGAGQDQATRVVQQADVLLRLGLVASEISDPWTSPEQRSDHRIDLQPASAAIGERVFDGVTLPDALAALQARLPKRTLATAPAGGQDRRFAPEQDATSITHDRLFEAVLDAIGDGDTVCVEHATSNAFVNATLPARARFISSVYFEPIGYSTAAMVGSSIGNRSSRHWLLCGDGAFQIAAQELSTAIRNRTAPIVVLMHNDVYAFENFAEPGGYHVWHYNDIARWSYAPLMSAFDEGGEAGSVGVTVRSEEGFTKALEDARAAQRDGRATLIEVKVSASEFPKWTIDDKTAGERLVEAWQQEEKQPAHA